MWSEGQLTLPWTLADLWLSCGPGRAGCSHPALCGPSDSPWFCCYNALVVWPAFRLSVVCAHIPQTPLSPVREGLPLSL